MARGKPGIIWTGGAGDDNFLGGDGNETFMGNEGNDTIDGAGGNDSIYGHDGDDILYGGAGSDTIMGNEGNDTIRSGDGDDFLYGQGGNDRLDGGTGNDMLFSGPGNDVLIGGPGADRFFFTSNFDSGMSHHIITDFSSAQGDYIDLRNIDADGDSSNNSRKGNTDFTFVDGPGGVAGTAWMVAFTDPATGGTGVSIYLNTDADAEADTRIDVLGVTSLTWGVDILG